MLLVECYKQKTDVSCVDARNGHWLHCRLRSYWHQARPWMRRVLVRGRWTVREPLETKEVKRNAIDMLCVFYKMSLFRANEIFSIWPFSLLQIGGHWMERLAHIFHSIANWFRGQRVFGTRNVGRRRVIAFSRLTLENWGMSSGSCHAVTGGPHRSAVGAMQPKLRVARPGGIARLTRRGRSVNQRMLQVLFKLALNFRIMEKEL